MNILALGKGILQRIDIGHMCSQPQLNLRIVGGEQHIAILRHKGLADLPPDFGTDRDILQVRIGGGQPSGLRADKAVAGVHAARARVDRFLQSVRVSALELGQLAIFQHLVGNRCAITREPFQHALIGRILAALALLAALVTERVEQHFAELFGAADGEFAPGVFVNFLFQPGDFSGKGFGQAREFSAVHLDTFALHRGDHRDQRAVDALVDAGRAFFW